MTALDRVLWLPEWMQAAAAEADFGRPGHDRIEVVDGFAWYGHGHCALRDLERTSKPAPPEGSGERLAELLAAPRLPVMPLRRTRVALGTGDAELVVMIDAGDVAVGMAIDARYHRLVQALYPGATWLGGEVAQLDAYAAWLRGAIVALVAPFTFAREDEVRDG